MHRFSNNAESTLSVELAEGDETLQVVPGSGALFNVMPVDMGDPFFRDGTHQAVTLTNPDMPNTYEIVYLVARLDDAFVAERGMEGTEPLAWPAGSKVSANVTAEMLRSFVQAAPYGKPVNTIADEGEGIGPVVLGAGMGGGGSGATGSRGFVVNAQSRVNDSWAIGGLSVLQHARPFNTNASQTARFAHAYETVGGTTPIDLGQAPAWVASKEYPRGAVVTAGDGNPMQYWPRFYNLEDDITSSETKPPFSPWVGDAAAGGNAAWIATELPLTAMFPGDALFVATEVGFICHSMTATAPPTISVGTDDDPTRYADNVQLASITAADTVHRILVPTGGLLTTGVRFALNVPAAGGSCRGRFYWKGFFIEPSYIDGGLG